MSKRHNMKKAKHRKVKTLKSHNGERPHHDNIMTPRHHDIAMSGHHDTATSRRQKAGIRIDGVSIVSRANSIACILRRHDDITLISAWHQAALIAIAEDFSERARLLIILRRYRKQWPTKAIAGRQVQN
jgi:hypothetical protein